MIYLFRMGKSTGASTKAAGGKTYTAVVADDINIAEAVSIQCDEKLT